LFEVGRIGELMRGETAQSLRHGVSANPHWRQRLPT
jgi:hypothetical protein